MKKIWRRSLSVVLSVLIVFASVVPVFAEVRVPTEQEEIESLIAFFNDSVNPLKTDLPRAKVTYNNYLPEHGLTMGGTSIEDDVDEMLSPFLIPIVEGLFNQRSSMARSMVQSMFGMEGNTVDELDLHRYTLRKNSIPVYGEDYVSALTPADDFSIYVDMEEGAAFPKQLAFTFNPTTLEEGKAGSIGKVFSLPSGSLDPTVFRGERTQQASRLDNVKINNFYLDEGRIATKYGPEGEIKYYGSTITYKCSISFSDCMNLLSVVLGYDFYSAGLNTVNVILSNLGREEMSAEDVMNDQQIYITYCCTVEITDINFDDRYFGDIDDNGVVAAGDARAALRHAVDLQRISQSNDRIYADINFDGEITAADARLILRTAAGMEELFTEVPSGKKILIVRIEEDVEDEEDEDDQPSEGDQPGSQNPGGIFDNLDPAVTMADIVNDIFTYIGFFKDAEGDSRNYITEFIESIQNAVEKNKENNKP